MPDESGSPEGRDMLNRMVTEVVGTPIPPTHEMFPMPRKPVGPSAHPEKFKVGKAGMHKAKASRVRKGSRKKNLFAGWD